MRNFLVCLLIICSSLFSNELPKNMNSVDVYSEYTYKYFSDGASVKLYSLLKYQNNKYKNQYGFKDILLWSLKEASDEAKRTGYENFHIMYYTSEPRKIVSNVTIDEYLNNLDPTKVNYLYQYNIGKKEGVGVGSIIALGANVAMGAAAVKNINSGNNVSSSVDVLGHSVDGVISDKSGKNIFKDMSGNAIYNKIEIDSFNKGIFYNVIEQYVWFMHDKNYIFNNPKTIKFTVEEVDKYFEKNPYRIKELYTTNKHLITRGLSDE